MTAPRKDKGIALVIMVVLAAILALMAESVARVAFDRVLIYNQIRDAHYFRFVTTSASGELRSCLAPAMSAAFPVPPAAPPACAGWGAWSYSDPKWTAAKDYPVGGAGVAASTISVTANWTESGLDLACEWTGPQ